MGKQYRWGILGAGRIAEKFCTALSYTEGSSVYAVASRDLTRAKDYVHRHGGVIAYDNYEALMDDPNIDIIYIASPHVFHFEHTMACLQKGKAVLCEKPMSLTYAQTSEMITAAKKAGVFLMEGMWTACMPFIEKIQSLIAVGSIGIPKYVTADFGFTSTPDATSRLYDKKLGGGALMDIGIYPLSLATILFGEPIEVKMVAKLTESGVDEFMNMVLKYPGGETAHLLSTISFNTEIEATIIGTEGKIKIANPWFKATDFSLHTNDGKVEQFSIPHGSNGFEHEIREVMTCLDKGLLESEKWPHHLTLTVSRLMDDALQQVGVRYP
ncbi:MAG: Gfo/Idh/MocA family oxidoreductase [Bacteroidota bacterium]